MFTSKYLMLLVSTWGLGYIGFFGSKPLSLLNIVDVEKTFAKVRAVAGVTLSIPQGEICGFLGPNGAGKTTLIRMIMDILRPDEGTITLADHVAGDRKSNIGYLPEVRGLYTQTEAVETLTYFAMLKGLDRKAATVEVDQFLDRLEMNHARGMAIGKLSKGNQQKIQFISAIVGHPKLLILDEPFSGLDPMNAKLISRCIEELRDEGISIILSTHQMNLAETFCSRIFLFNEGELILEGPLEEIIRENSGNKWLLNTQEPLPDSDLFQVLSREEEETTLTLNPGADVRQLMQWLAEQPFETQSLKPYRMPLSEIFIAEVNKHG